MQDPIYLLPGQKAVILTEEAWTKITRYLHENFVGWPEDIRNIILAIIIQTTNATGD